MSNGSIFDPVICALPGANNWAARCGGGFFGAGMITHPNIEPGQGLGPPIEGSPIDPGQLVVDVGNPFPPPVVGPSGGAFLGPLILPAVVAPAVLGGLATGGAAGIGLSLLAGAAVPTESLTGSGLEPETETSPALAPPAPPGGSVVAATPELPPNWWDLMQGFPLPALGAKDVLDWLSNYQPPGTTQIGRQLWNLINPGNVSDPGSLFGPPFDSPAGSTEPVGTVPATDLPTITVEAPRPARAPPVVADPVFSPVSFPEPGFVPLPAPSTPTRPARTRAPGPALRPAPSPGLVPGPQRGVAPQPTPIALPSPAAQPSPIEAPSPSPTPVPAPPKPALAPSVLTSLSPVIIGPSVAPGAPGPTIAGFAAVPTVEDLPSTLAQMQPGYTNPQKTCVQTKTKDKGKKKKHQRSVCHTGTYRELKSGLIKHATRTIPCQ